MEPGVGGPVAPVVVTPTRPQRSSADLLILMIAGTICLVIVGALATAAVIEVVHPEADTSALGTTISGAVSTMVGLLSGFLAGRTETVRRRTNGERD